MQDLAAPPPLPPPQWHHRLTFFLFLFLFLPPPASYQTATEPRSPQSGSGPGLGRRPALGMCPHWGCADAGLFPLRSPGQHLVCLQRGDQCWPRAALGSCKEAPCPGEGAIPCVRPGLGGGVDMHRKLGADRWVLGAGGHRPGGGWQAPGEAVSGAIKSSAPSQSHLRTARAGEQGASGNPLGAVAAHSLSFLVFKMRSHGAGSVRLHR